MDDDIERSYPDDSSLSIQSEKVNSFVTSSFLSLE